MRATPKQIIEAAGMKYLGEQQMPKGKPAAHMFNAASGSTLMICGDVTAEIVTAKLAAHAAQVFSTRAA